MSSSTVKFIGSFNLFLLLKLIGKCAHLYLIVNLSAAKFVKILYAVTWSLPSRILHVFRKYGSVSSEKIMQFNSKLI